MNQFIKNLNNTFITIFHSLFGLSGSYASQADDDGLPTQRDRYFQ